MCTNLPTNLYTDVTKEGHGENLVCHQIPIGEKLGQMYPYLAVVHQMTERNLLTHPTDEQRVAIAESVRRTFDSLTMHLERHHHVSIVR